MVERWECHERSYTNLRVGVAVGYDHAASLNFLANRWLETHTPFIISTILPLPSQVHTLPTIKPLNLPSTSRVIILAIVDLTVL